jgi:hypothetical protein
LQTLGKLALLRFALREREPDFVTRLRRSLLEFWAILMLTVVVGFMGPFGTYLQGDFPARAWRWWQLLVGAYILVRPTMLGWRWIARATGLPSGTMMFCGVLVSSFPMAMIWRASAPREVQLLGGYPGLLPFALLCSLAVMWVAWWADRADAHLRLHYRMGDDRSGDRQPASRHDMITPNPVQVTKTTQQPLRARLSPRFQGEILALESEDHYVRVHGANYSELLLLRLRDAIAEMTGCPGEQTHRSWWVARSGVSETISLGRNWEIRLTNGMRVPVARDSIERLRAAGLLPE